VGPFPLWDSRPSGIRLQLDLAPVGIGYGAQQAGLKSLRKHPAFMDLARSTGLP